jgi:hypothetical protein
MTEIWKDIPDYENAYQVSDMGRIRSLTKQVKTKGENNYRTVKGQIRKIFPNKSGYMTVVLSKSNKLRTFTVHQLVAMTFFPDFIKGTQINHIDGDPANNSLSNLEVSNSSHNQLHALKTGLRPIRGVSKYRNVSYVKNPRAKSKWCASIRHNGRNSYGWKTFETEEAAAKYVDELLDSIGDTQRARNFPSVP